MERNMAGEFVIEALESRQLLSGSPTTTSAAPSTLSTAVVSTVTIATAAITNSSITSSSTENSKAPAFVRPGSNTSSGTSTSTTEASTIPWGTDIYPPPVFTGTSGQGTHRTTVTVGPAAPTGIASTTTASTVGSPTPILIGHHSGKHVSKHFSVRPDDEHGGRPNAILIGPDIASTPASRLPTPRVATGPFTTGVFSDVSHPSVFQNASVHAVFSTSSTTFHDISTANWTPPMGTISHSTLMGRSISVGSSSVPLSAPPDAPAVSSAADRLMRSMSANGLDGLLLPLATMDTSIIAGPATMVGKWEVNVAIGSLSVVVCGYWYLSDAAARRRRQRALAVSVFCDKPVE
jgi:hypothetical protein